MVCISYVRCACRECVCRLAVLHGLIFVDGLLCLYCVYVYGCVCVCVCVWCLACIFILCLCWLLAAGCWLLAAGCWLLVAGVWVAMCSANTVCNIHSGVPQIARTRKSRMTKMWKVSKSWCCARTESVRLADARCASVSLSGLARRLGG